MDREPTHRVGHARARGRLPGVIARRTRDRSGEGDCRWGFGLILINRDRITVNLFAFFAGSPVRVSDLTVRRSPLSPDRGLKLLLQGPVPLDELADECDGDAAAGGPGRFDEPAEVGGIVADLPAVRVQPVPLKGGTRR